MKASDIYKTPTGSVTMILHKGGNLSLEKNEIIDGEIIAKREIKNLIVNSASTLMAMRMAPGKIEGHVDVATGEYIPGKVGGEYNTSGLKFLAVGTGLLLDPNRDYDENDNPSTWDLQNPPEEELTVDKLAGEFYRKQFTDWKLFSIKFPCQFINCYRKQFTDWKFLDMFGNLSPSPTNVLLLSTTFLESEAVGPIVEMGIFGDNSATTAKDTGMMFNYKTFKVWNKPNSCRLSIIWKLTF
jgi:hypothetical protein